MLDSDGVIVRCVARAAARTRRSALGGMLVVALVLASLGASAGIAMRSLSDPSQPMFSSPAPVPARVSDATATELALVRASSLPRVEQAAGPGPATGATFTDTTASRSVHAATRRGARGDAAHTPRVHPARPSAGAARGASHVDVARPRAHASAQATRGGGAAARPARH
jgi:hypothetical protein